MACADDRFPNIGQMRFHTIAVLLPYHGPSYIEIEIFVLLYLRIPPVISDTFLDIPLPDVHNRGIWPPVPNDIDTVGGIVKMLVVHIYEIEFAPDTAIALCAV